MARSGSRKTLTIHGNNPYQITAEILALAAKTITGQDFTMKGLLPPSAIFGDAQFFQAMQDFGIGINQEKND